MDILLFFLFLAATIGAGATGALFPTGSWYKGLNKPSWVPPNWLFPVAWTSIYLLIAFAGARVAGLEASAYAMAFWAIQIVLNALWTPVFFGAFDLTGAFTIIVMLWSSITALSSSALELIRYQVICLCLIGRGSVSLQC